MKLVISIWQILGSQNSFNHRHSKLILSVAQQNILHQKFWIKRATVSLLIGGLLVCWCMKCPLADHLLCIKIIINSACS